MSLRSTGITCAIVTLFLFGFYAIWTFVDRRAGREPVGDSEIDAARAALAEGEVARARQLASEVPQDDSQWADAQVILGGIASRSGDAQAALRHYTAVPRNGSPASVTAALAAAELEQASGHLSAAIDSYVYVLEYDPDQVQVRKELADLYALTGQRWLADRQFRLLVKTPELDFRQLVWMTDFERRDPHGIDFLQKCAENFPDDPAVNLGMAFESMAGADLESARRRLETALTGDPELGAAQGLKGELLLDAGDEALTQWHLQLAESVRNDPGVWYVRGLWARRRGENEIAARCFWEAARQIPTSHRAMHQLGLTMTEVDPGIGRILAARAEQLYELRQNLSAMLNSQGRNEPAMRTVVEILLEEGREWEAWSWAVYARRMYQQSAWVDEVLSRLSTYPHIDTPRIVESRDLLARYDLSYYEEFDRLLSDSTSSAPAAAAELRHSTIRFFDQATDLGIDFIYHQGRTEGVDGVRMQESTGGGIAVVDFNSDGLPDLFLTQGENWPADSDTPAPTAEDQDRLFVNLGVGFQDATNDARVPREDGFGQGCSAGDFNNDGFVDLYIANIGVNQLLINQGDGTFIDVTEELNVTTSAWTTSCLIADLNADGNPDLFDVNYVKGDNLYRMVCEEHECTPQAYSDAADDLHLSWGDGSIRTIGLNSVEYGGGAGLAVVALRLDLSPADVASAPQPAATGDNTTEARSSRSFDFDPDRLCLFIANDHEPNFFLMNTPADNPENIELTEFGFLTGLAVNHQGEPTACMGVASGDADGDRRTDLFVTNYKAEANSLYLQGSGGCFRDEIAATGLLAPGLPYVGWGTQFIDADNKGLADLVVTNGHVGDFHKAGVEYHMPTQFFYNHGGARFEELAPDSVGPFFARKMLGRSLATLDWNRDGLTDFAVSPIASEFALLTNHTVNAGNAAAFRLHGVSASRDAIGTIVTITTEAGEMRRQLTAGDGYQVTNERMLRFGLGRQDIVEKVVIDWPGGMTETIEDIPGNTLTDVVEGMCHTTQRLGAVSLVRNQTDLHR